MINETSTAWNIYIYYTAYTNQYIIVRVLCFWEMAFTYTVSTEQINQDFLHWSPILMVLIHVSLFKMVIYINVFLIKHLILPTIIAKTML